ncbi:MAG: hypothetical protein J07HB67_01402 [halophilic archaeon J07HB67]|nr:MAG: hypothetical protein J07HB67_01402 [halophilic archaeon J07HB67]
MEIQRHTLIETFGDSIGRQKAERMVADAAERAGVPDRRTLSREEAMAVADCLAELDEAGTVARVSASTVKTQITTGNIQT